MDQDDVRCAVHQGFEPGMDRSLPGGAARDRFQQIVQARDRIPVGRFIAGMNDRLHRANAGVIEQACQRRADHGFPRDLTVLFRQASAGALAAPGSDNDSGHHSSHGTPRSRLNLRLNACPANVRPPSKTSPAGSMEKPSGHWGVASTY